MSVWEDATADELSYLINDDPEMYISYVKNGMFSKECKHYDNDEFIRIVIVDDRSGYVVDYYVEDILPREFGDNFANMMDGHFEAKMSESDMVKMMERLNIKVTTKGVAFKERVSWNLRLPCEPSVMDD